ncbi:uracil-DNA glycosylase [Candidatus Saccharibacteria bacterium]|nr:MAG: uracil-DNA glycosylase [Candidatus Saccharibacteria bacterium]
MSEAIYLRIVVSKQTELAQIKADILEKNICPNLAGTAKQLVMGDGNPDADIVFIGEAPGKNEDEQGLPFVGAAGKFLDEMLASVGLERKDIFITNIVKYRPPNNRDPLPEEKQAFWPFLARQLEIIQPKVIVTLGRHSMEFFLPDARISHIHGQPKRLHFRSRRRTEDDSSDAMQGAGEQRTEVDKKSSEGAAEPATQQGAETLGASDGSAGDVYEWTIILLPLYHPAAALYNGGMRQTLIDDFSQVRTIVEKY